MKIGSILRLRDFRCYQNDGKSYAGFTAGKSAQTDDKQVFVCVLLGTEPLVVKDDAQALDVEKRMFDLGWAPCDPKKIAATIITPTDLHDALDRLVASYLSEKKTKRLSNTTVMELLEWSAKKVKLDARCRNCGSENFTMEPIHGADGVESRKVCSDCKRARDKA